MDIGCRVAVGVGVWVGITVEVGEGAGVDENPFATAEDVAVVLLTLTGCVNRPDVLGSRFTAECLHEISMNAS